MNETKFVISCYLHCGVGLGGGQYTNKDMNVHFVSCKSYREKLNRKKERDCCRNRVDAA